MVLRSTFFIGETGALFSGLVGYLFLRYVFKTPQTLNEEKINELQDAKISTPTSPARSITPVSTTNTAEDSDYDDSTMPRNKQESEWSSDLLKNNALIETLREYSGELTKNEKGDLKVSKEEPLKITWRDFCITIREQDMFESKAQVLVNAANIMLQAGGGIDGAINSKGGTVYQHEHKNLHDYYNGTFRSGFAALVESGQLVKNGFEKFIIVAGPRGLDTDMTQQEKNDALYSCYYNSLCLAHEHNKASIAFPSISTGLFRFDKDIAARVSLRAIYDFITRHPESPVKIISIHWQRDNSPLVRNPTAVLDSYLNCL